MLGVDNNNELLKNLKKIASKYQEVILSILRGKGWIFPRSLIDNDKITILLASLTEQYVQNPQKFLNVNFEYIQKLQDLISYSLAKSLGQEASPLYKPTSKDRRFKSPEWENSIFFDFIKQFHLLSSEYLQRTIAQYELTPEIKRYLEFISQQLINALAPSNFVFTNPEVLKESLASNYQNLIKGLDNLLADIKKSSEVLNIATTSKSFFKIGDNIASTPGKVVFENQLVQLICYEPQNNTYSIPILLVPPWINKYYILDLSPSNSLVKWLVNNNFQVFIISWINPGAELAHKNFEDYLREGVLETSKFIVNLGYEKINLAGYCIGGTLLAAAASFMATNNINCINSATFIASLLDFSNPGDIGIFINESSIALMEAEMARTGYFDGRYLANNFSLLRANDLVWSFFIHNYLLGHKPLPLDLLYWNADCTNLPAKMHSYYLRNMYLNNLLKAPGKLQMLGTPINLSNINCPSFFIAAQDDHIVPWQSVYEGTKILGGDKVFCLTASGHVAGIINHPDNSKYYYKINENLTPDATDWLSNATEHKGSWWKYWQEWLIPRSGTLEKSLNYHQLKFIEPAPGSYVQLSHLS